MTFDHYDERVQPRAAALSFGFTESMGQEPAKSPLACPDQRRRVKLVMSRARAEVKWVISNGQKVKCRQQSSGNR